MSIHSDAALQGTSSDSDDDEVPSAQGVDDREELDDAEERASKRCRLAEGVAGIGQQVKALQVTLHMRMLDMVLHSAVSPVSFVDAVLLRHLVASC